MAGVGDINRERRIDGQSIRMIQTSAGGADPDRRAQVIAAGLGTLFVVVHCCTALILRTRLLTESVT